MEKVNIHKFIFCNINIYFGQILRNSLSLSVIGRACVTVLGRRTYRGQVENRESSFFGGIISLLQVLNRSWDIEDMSSGEAMCLADMWWEEG